MTPQRVQPSARRSLRPHLLGEAESGQRVVGRDLALDELVEHRPLAGGQLGSAARTPPRATALTGSANTGVAGQDAVAGAHHSVGDQPGHPAALLFTGLRGELHDSGVAKSSRAGDHAAGDHAAGDVIRVVLCHFVKVFCCPRQYRRCPVRYTRTVVRCDGAADVGSGGVGNGCVTLHKSTGESPVPVSAPERRIADPSCWGETPGPERGVESLRSGKSA